MQDEFESVGPGRKAQRRPDCPELSIWYELAAGITAAADAQLYLDHAATCDFCRPLLRDAVADLNEETTPSEAKQLADLESARPEWQRRLVQRITGKTAPAPAPPWRRWITVPRLVFATSALVAGIVAFQIVARPSPSEKANSLLARAYGEKRTLKMRMSGMPYARAGEGMKRDADSSFLDRPDTLLQAEVLISKQLALHPADAKWLQAKARADLMEGKYQSALESLRRADQLAPKSPEILTDLAIANFQLGRYDVAYETLSQVLALNPDNQLALFNRAFAAEQLHLYHQALDDADRYVQLDPNSKWAEEARALADSIRTLLQRHDQSRQTPLLTPEQIAASLNDPALRAQVDERVEEYLKEAAVSWLPRAFPEKASSADPAARQALFFLADLTRERHNDLWLSDLLRGSSAPDFPKAVAALSRAIQANTAGEYNISTEQGRRAEQWFRTGGVTTGVLRARFEQVYAAHFKKEPCRLAAAAAESEKRPYPWLQAQLGLEQAVCLVRKADIGGDEFLSRGAMDRARQANYAEIYLRALFFTADDERLTGNLAAASNLLSRGLRRFWSGQFPAMQGYNLYEALAFTADAAGQRHLTYAIWREAVALIDSNEDLLLRAWAHRTLADSAISSGLPQVAHRHYAEAARLFDLAPTTRASQTAVLENEISSAQLEAHLGRFDVAIERLTSIQDRVRPLSNSDLLQMFYATLGELQLGRHRAVEAEQALRPAMAIAEQNLRSIQSESDRIRWSQNAAPIYLGLTQAELEQGRSQESLEIFEWYLAASLRQRSTKQSNQTPDLSGSSTPQPSRMASRLPFLSRETVIAYGLLPGGLAIWVYDDRGVVAQWIPKPSHDLQELIERFSDLTSDPHSDLSAVRRDARSLYQGLIQPAEERLVPGRTLVIEADGVLARVPFEVLRDSEGHYLVERWPIVYSLGQEVEARLRGGDHVSSDWPALVVGSTAALAGRDVIPLPNVGAEADAIARGFHASKVLKGDEATLTAVRSALASAALFHFAGHSLTTPDRSGLLLQSGSSRNDRPALLDATTLRHLPLPNLRLAVLSACSTASGNEGSNGFGSVMDALLRAGVPHVVASRWPVDSVETRAFMDDFYRNALSGQSVSDAIRLTSRKMMAGPSTAHPYYWSAFAAYGRP